MPSKFRFTIRTCNPAYHRSHIVIVYGTIRDGISSNKNLCKIISTLPNSIVDACNVNAFKARLDKFWQHQLVKFDFTADLTGTGNRSEEVRM